VEEEEKREGEERRQEMRKNKIKSPPCSLTLLQISVIHKICFNQAILLEGLINLPVKLVNTGRSLFLFK
jgi:hypothetical protein